MIKLKNTPEQLELVKQIGSKDLAVSRPATEAFAVAIGSVIAEVLKQAGTASLIYEDQTFQEDDSPSFPLDLYYNEDVGMVTVWSQSIAGGLPSSKVEGVAELKISTYTLDSAVHFLKKYARKSNLNVLNKAVDRMLQEVLVKQEKMAWSIILKALAEASTAGVDHVIASTTADVFQLDDLNRLMTLAKRLNQSFAGGTPVAPYSRGITDLFVSPEIKEQIRGFAYNPMNTRVGPTVPGSTLANYTATTAVPLPDSIREEIYRNAGSSEIFGVNITDLNELGTTRKYNVLFDSFYSASTPTFAGATDEVCIGVDLTRGAFIRAVATDSETSATFSVQPDDQWVARSDTAGFYGSLQEGRVCIDSRAILGLIV
jgi:hypothetical protein